MSKLNKTVTVEMIMEHHPCREWTEERIRDRIGEGKTLLDILDIDVEADEKKWCVLRFLPDKVNRAFAIWCARQCYTDVEEITEYIDVIEKYYNGEANREELEKACSAAYRVAYYREDRGAFWASDRAAYGAAYWSAYGAAYWSAYWAAEMAAERAAEGEKQIQKLKEMIRRRDER